MESDFSNLLEPSIGFGSSQPFEKLKSSWIAWLQLFFTVALEAATILLTFILRSEEDTCEPLLYIFLFFLAIYWFISWITDFLFKQAHLKVKRNGYFEFFNVASHYASKPHKIASLWNSIFMVLIGVYNVDGISFKQFCDKNFPLSMLYVTVILLTMESVLIVYYLVTYLLKVKDFNRVQPATDTEHGCSWTLNEHFPTSELGYRERWELVENLLEKQADVIMHFSHANKELNQKLLELMNRQKQTDPV